MTPPAFSWADKAMLSRIRKDVQEVGSALAVYHALCEIASDHASDEFTSTQIYIARKAGFSVRTVTSRLADLVRVKAIRMATPALRAPSQFTMLSSFGNHCRALRNGGGAIRNKPTTSFADTRRKESTSEKPSPKGSGSSAPTGGTIPRDEQLTMLREVLR